MYLIVSLVIIVFLLFLCFGVVRARAYQVKHAAQFLEDALWDRLNKLPLLFELCKQIPEVSRQIKEAIDLRASLMSHIALTEKLPLNQELTKIISELITLCGTTSLKTDGVFLSLIHELTEALEQIKVRLEDLIVAQQTWRKISKWPWFAIFRFLFKNAF